MEYLNISPPKMVMRINECIINNLSVDSCKIKNLEVDKNFKSENIEIKSGRLNFENCIIIGNDMCNNNEYFMCYSCSNNIVSGVVWKQDRYEDDNSQGKLCFNCILDVILQIKAKEEYIKNIGYDPMTKLMNDISFLKDEINILKNEPQKK